MNGVASRLDCRVFTLSPERYTKTIEVAFYVVRKESPKQHRLSVQRMRRQKLVVKWFYITVFFQYQSRQAAPLQRGRQRMREVENAVFAATAGNTAPTTLRQVVLALPYTFLSVAVSTLK
ncbi:MAG: hypothetical protein I4O49_17625 [Janthinobacterium lividum]|nr:hypothetical protein [Janthinobacterium lividum]